MHLCKCNDSAAFFHHLLPIYTRFLYTSVECACGTLQTNRQIKFNCLTKCMATVQVIHTSLLCCHVLNLNNCAAVLDHFRSILKRQLCTDKDSRCGALSICSPFTYTFISHWMAGVQVIWFSVPITCIYANVTTLQHFFTISCQYAHVFCIHQWSVHVVHYKPTEIKLNCLTKCMATVQVIHTSLLCCHVLNLNNCAAVLNHFRSTVKRQLYTDKDSRCGTL